MSPADSLSALLDEGLERGFFPGAAAVVADASGLLREEYRGDAVVEPSGSRTAAGPGTLWDLASLTKPLAGAALVLALAEGRALALDDGIGRFHDLFRRTRFDGVTLRALLLHAAGLAAWFPCYVRGEGRAAYRRALSEADAERPPGRGVTYSCLGYLLLAEAVETAAAAPLDLLFRERVAAPLELAADLLFAPGEGDRPRCAGGERDDATERRMVAERGLAYGGFRTGIVTGEANDGNAWRRGAGVSLNAGLFGTARAVAAAARAWLARDPRLLREASVADAVSCGTEGLGERRGLGWQLASETNGAGPALHASSFGHTGFTGSSVWIDPRAGRVYVLLANRLHPDARAVDMNEVRRRFHEAASRL